MIIVELSYFLNILIDSFKAYENDVELNTYEKDWRKTTLRYWKSSELKAQILIILPFGALGFIKQVEWMRIFWIFKICRINFFKRIFDYHKTIDFLKKILNAKKILSLRKHTDHEFEDKAKCE